MSFRLQAAEKRRASGFCLNVTSLEIRRHQTLILLGPTGSGKTTLLRLLAGLETADAGKITLDEVQSVSRQMPLSARRRIAFVHQQPMLLAGSVRYNVEYGLRLRRSDRSRERVDAVLGQLGLAQLAGQSASTLSGGQTQLVSLARALVISPDVLLLDEPTANLDPAHVALVEQTLSRSIAERPTTLVWATHNLFQARRVANRVALLWNGRVVEEAARDEFFEHPKDPRTVEFVEGRMIY